MHLNTAHFTWKLFILKTHHVHFLCIQHIRKYLLNQLQHEVTMYCISYLFPDTDQCLVSPRSNFIKANPEWYWWHSLKCHQTLLFCVTSWTVNDVSVCHQHVLIERRNELCDSTYFPDRKTLQILVCLRFTYIINKVPRSSKAVPCVKHTMHHL